MEIGLSLGLTSPLLRRGSPAPSGFFARGVTPATEFVPFVSGNLSAEDGPVVAFAFWARQPFDAGQLTISGNDGYFYLSLDGYESGTAAFSVGDYPDFERYVDIRATVPDDTWDCYIVKMRTDAAEGLKVAQAYRNDASIISSIDDVGESFDIPLSLDPFRIAINSGVSIAEVWLSTEDLDFSQESVRRKFVDANGKPVDLAPDGSAPTGTAPLLYLSARQGDAVSAFLTNRAGGPAWSVSNGALAFSSTSPSD